MILHLVTDRRRLSGAGASLSEQRRCLLLQVRHAVDAGIDIVQVRERDLEGAALFAIAQDCVAAAAGSRTRIVVNDRVDIALAARAHGVHLRTDSLPPAVVRRLAPRGFLIGRSVHDPDEAALLGRDVDYLVAGTVWRTPSKAENHPLLGVEGLARVVQSAHVPVLAIGGVSIERLPQVAAARAAGVAAIGLFMRDPRSTDKEGECGAIPLHELARLAAARFADGDLPAAR